jgi:DNA-binding SARP family transcriptional activator
MLSIRLFGQFQLRRGDEAPVAVESARAESLLAFLLLHRDSAQPRQHVAFLLWPDSAETQALTNLQHVLHNLRKAFWELDRHVEVTARTLRWRDDQPYFLDVAAFEDALARGAWRDAVESYAGDLLAGRPDEWIEDERARLRRLYLDALERLVAECPEQRDLEGAVHFAERLLREEPLREGTYLPDSAS